MTVFLFRLLLQHSISKVAVSIQVLSCNRHSLLFLEVVSDTFISLLIPQDPRPSVPLSCHLPLDLSCPSWLRIRPQKLSFPSGHGPVFFTHIPSLSNFTHTHGFTLKVTPKPVSGFQLLFGPHYNAPSFLSGFLSRSAWNLVFPPVLCTEYLFFPKSKVEALTLNVMVFGDGVFRWSWEWGHEGRALMRGLMPLLEE